MWFGRSIVVTLVLLVVSCAACGGDPPDKEIQQAQNAVDQARAAGADRYALEEYTAAVDALKNAHAAVEQRDYRLALNDALDSKERAENATKLAIDGKAAARSAADKSLTAANAAITAAEAKIKAAGSGKIPARTVADARAALDQAQKHLQEARTAFSSQDYYAVLSAASLATQSARGATDKLDTSPTGQPRRR